MRGDMAVSYEVPADWGQNSLSGFIETVRQNTLVTFANLRPQYNRLCEIHLLYHDLIDNLHNARNWFSAFFVVRAHASYLGGVRFALSGQVSETYMVLQGCLENALYGHYFQRNPASRETWLRRSDDEQSRQRVRKEFTASALLRCLESADHKIHRMTKQLYEQTIDYGAHPNKDAVLTMMTKTEDDDSQRYLLNYLSGGTLPFQLALKTTAQVGICTLYIFRTVYRERFDLLQLTDRLHQLSVGL
jgi:hypothetical protein